ncbi:MAG: PQQ-dependent sugar dehydrogenase [Gammaproteobacteria bacterium]
MRHQRAVILFLLTALSTAGLRLDAAPTSPACDKDIGGITLPAGFCATVFADKLGVARHIAVDASGDVYVALEQTVDGKGIVALRDRGGTGHADVLQRFGDFAGSGLGIHGDYLYFATPTTVLRYRLTAGRLLPQSNAETVVSGFPTQDEHAAKSIALDTSGHLYVNVGAPSNACQDDDRSPGSPGKRPCLLLQEHGGIWRFDADKTGQRFPADGLHYATGIRNAVAVTWNDPAKAFYALQMGRDELGDNWPKLYNDTQNAELPAEEFLRVEQGDDFGWPYCYYDQFQQKLVQAPEYGGDGKQVGDCSKYGQSIAAFPGHWAPEAVLFYSGSGFPAQYQGGAFITFHGSWNRAPLPQAGYKVVFLPFKDGKPSGPYQVFADGFAGSAGLVSPSDARYRPMGIAEGPDGALYIGDTQQGRIWRVVYSPGH